MTLQAPAHPDTLFTLPTVREVFEGVGVSTRLGEILAARDITCIAVLTSPSVAATPYFSSILDGLDGVTTTVINDVRPHNPLTKLAQITARAAAHPLDAIVAIGGGSSIDAAKLVAASLRMGHADASGLSQIAMQTREGSFEPPSRTPEIMAVPTTLSAAEWNGFAGAVNSDHVKLMIGHLDLTPRLVVLDPGLVALTPRHLWTTTGVRTLDHAVESLQSTQAHPFTDALALGAVAGIVDNLPASAVDERDMGAALACLRAAWTSSIGVHNVRLGLSHAIGHQLGVVGVPHGVTSCVAMPHVLRFLGDHAAPAQTRIVQAMASVGYAADTAAEAVEDWLDTLGVPRQLRAFDLDDATLDFVARSTLESPLIASVPTSVTAADVRQILAAAW